MTESKVEVQPDPDQAWKALALVNEWLKHAEAKGGATLAGAGVAGGVLYNLLRNQSSPGLALDVVATLCGVATFAAGLLALIALIPKLRPPVPRRSRTARTAPATRTQPDEEIEAAATAGEDDPINLLFFGDIARVYAGDPPSYTDVLTALTSDPGDLTSHIARQVHANALVAHRKYLWAERAIRALGLAVVLLAVTAALVGSR